MSEPTAVDQAYDALLAFVEAAPDRSRLPAERSLATRLGVSRSTLRTAVDRLVRLGLLKVMHGSGTVVHKSGGAVLALPFQELLARLPHDRSELFELRRILEPRLAGLAARRRSDAQATSITAMSESSGPAFYVAVAEAAGNAHATALVKLLAATLDVAPSGEPASEATDLLSLQRTAVAAAIYARDARSASEAMAAHLRTVGRLQSAP